MSDWLRGQHVDREWLAAPFSLAIVVRIVDLASVLVCEGFGGEIETPMLWPALGTRCSDEVCGRVGAGVWHRTESRR